MVITLNENEIKGILLKVLESRFDSTFDPDCSDSFFTLDDVEAECSVRFCVWQDTEYADR